MAKKSLKKFVKNAGFVKRVRSFTFAMANYHQVLINH
jgi:hypothetical protein